MQVEAKNKQNKKTATGTWTQEMHLIHQCEQVPFLLCQEEKTSQMKHQIP